MIYTSIVFTFLPGPDTHPSSCWVLIGVWRKWWNACTVIDTTWAFRVRVPTAMRSFALQCTLQLVIWCSVLKNCCCWWRWKGCFLCRKFSTFLYPSLEFLVVMELVYVTQFCLENNATISGILSFKLQSLLKAYFVNKQFIKTTWRPWRGFSTNSTVFWNSWDPKGKRPKRDVPPFTGSARPCTNKDLGIL